VTVEERVVRGGDVGILAEKGASLAVLGSAVTDANLIGIGFQGPGASGVIEDSDVHDVAEFRVSVFAPGGTVAVRDTAIHGMANRGFVASGLDLAVRGNHAIGGSIGIAVDDADSEVVIAGNSISGVEATGILIEAGMATVERKPRTIRLHVTTAVRYIFIYRPFQYGVPEAFWRATVVGREFARALLMTYRGDELVGLSQAADQLGWRWPRLREALAEGGVELLYDPDQSRLLLPPESLEALRRSRFMITPERLDATVSIEEPETGTIRLFNRQSGKTTLRGGEEGRIQNLVRRSRYLQKHGLADPE
jgi:hypothetical protein